VIDIDRFTLFSISRRYSSLGGTGAAFSRAVDSRDVFSSFE
jgi:hypothetical protein